MQSSEKKKLLMIAGGIVGLLVLIVIILLMYNAIFGKTSFKKVENKVLEAAQKYYKEHENLLPKNESEQVRTNDTSLTAAGYLKEMSKLTEKLNATCKADVVVSYVNGNYRYTVLLDCGEKYATKTLSSEIKNNVEKVYTGEGLYEMNGELVYRGENPNNYVKFSNKIWRIVKIVDDEVVLILNSKYEKTVWDDRFNSEKDRNEGINDYRVSRIYDLLTETYELNELFTKDTKNLLTQYTLYIGKRLETDDYNDGSIEKADIYEKQYIGVLPLYDYLNASLDRNCTSALTYNCQNYNYLSYYDYNWWTITADQSNSYKVYRISSEGIVENIKSASNGYVRPVIHLAKDALYVSGDGTENNPYVIK